jgi:hypothetical protein
MATIVLEIPPYGTAQVDCDSKATSRALENNWATIWPEALQLLKDRMQNLDIEIDLSQMELVGSAVRTESGKFMSDKSDIYLSLSYGEAPDWDYFIRGTTIVHFQPVF